MFGARFDPSSFEEEYDEPQKKSPILIRKRRLSHATVDSDKEEEDIESDNNEESQSESESESDSESENENNIEEESNDEESSEDQSSEDESSEEDSSNDESDEEETQKQESTTSKEEDKDDMEIDSVPELDPDYLSKHQSIFKKFNKTIKRQELKQDSSSSEEEEEEIEVQDLAPLPQPALPRDKRLTSNTANLNNLNWLTTPIYVSPQDTKPFQDFELSSFMLKNLSHLNFTHAFSVQIAVLNLLLKDIKDNKLQPDFKGDLLVNASTGSGKTLAYSIPIIESLHTRIVPRVRAIILVPTKPLINQVKTTLNQLSKGTNLLITSLKNDISINEESNKLMLNIPDIIISTPGRLVEHISNNSINLSALEYLVIDEADRLLNQSFQNWCSILMSKIDHNINIANTWKLRVKKLIFSATLTTDAGKLTPLKFQIPRLIIVNDEERLVNELYTVPSKLKEFSLKFGSSKSSIKPLILTKYLLQQQKLANILIFTKSNDSSLRLAKLLQLLFNKYVHLSPEPIEVSYINSTNNKTAIRTKILKDFSQQKVHILIATDLIARGIDILSITDVINYDLPNSSREYVHRVGRTARAQQDGNAYNFLFGKGEAKWFKKLMTDIGRDSPIQNIDVTAKELVTAEDETLYETCLQELQKQVHSK
ncbi:P-loop containing nucleoside triphosphate hydrolase protein [Scheffersomyces coipomensis]|uniref:P-loop containing nucleoside triphosphate hydrolase protein n=1 Tax=Scheffersomyces coipomensis TaxID=1788519 RepID=UPI00315C57D9